MRKNHGVLIDRVALRSAVAETILHFRKRSGLSQESLAYIAGINRAYIGELEGGEHAPTLRLVFKLCGALEISVSEFAVECEARYHRRRKQKNPGISPGSGK